jgi:predicted metal-binding membrane protein
MRRVGSGTPGVALKRDRTGLITGAVLILAALVAWAVLLAQPAMSMSPSPDVGGATAFLLAWGTMMAAMMLPSAVPMIALYSVIRRNAASSGEKSIPASVFTLVYILIWVAAGIPIYLASLALANQPQFDEFLPYALAAVLIVAGAYQLTPLKRACLRVCRNPLSFFIARSRTGYSGSFGLAVEHALYCVGCCWALMVVLVAAGAMALNWVLLIAAVVFIEKVLPRGDWSTIVSGVLLIGLGVAVALNPDLAMMLRPAPVSM